MKIKGGILGYGNVKKNFVIIEGSIPGPRKRLIFMRKSVRKTDVKDAIEIKSVRLDSQQ
ncbi:MAG: 50S ribosomal protein L3 [Candidatus Aenigmarchaeota archaeon]|nr:50S ribosomal protein L3 [Candidatus Aenigmarchaeota archaeon]